MDPYKKVPAGKRFHFPFSAGVFLSLCGSDVWNELLSFVLTQIPGMVHREKSFR